MTDQLLWTGGKAVLTWYLTGLLCLPLLFCVFLMVHIALAMGMAWNWLKKVQHRVSKPPCLLNLQTEHPPVQLSPLDTNFGGTIGVQCDSPAPAQAASVSGSR